MKAHNKHFTGTILFLTVLAALLCSCSHSNQAGKTGHRAYEDGNNPAYLMNIMIDSKNVIKETYLYSCLSSGTGSDLKIDSLFLDRYYCPVTDEALQPCMIFVFGGGFSHGARDREKYLDYFNYLASNGYNVVSIDYRLGLQTPFEHRANKVAFAKYAVGRFMTSVDIAVEDLFNATKFVLNKSSEWGVDPSHIFISGSSAGAITVLQAEYQLCAGQCKVLPEDFDYSGVIAFSGAILLQKGSLKWDRRPCPILFFHGDADSNVPYGKIRTPWCSLNGSSVIASSLDDFNKSVDRRARKALRKMRRKYFHGTGNQSEVSNANDSTGQTNSALASSAELAATLRAYEEAGVEYASYTFYSYQGVDHSLAEKPMYENLPQLMLFLKECSTENLKTMPLCQTMKLQDRRRPVKNYRIGVFDYFKSNYSN